MIRLLRLASTVASALVILSFALFAIDEAGESSKGQVDKIRGVDRPSPPPQDEQRREREHSQVRELIDDANDILLEPFAGIVDSDDKWVQRGVPALIAVLLYGFAVHLLLNYVAAGVASGRRRFGRRA
jgi:hypothetical protein